MQERNDIRWSPCTFQKSIAWWAFCYYFKYNKDGEIVGPTTLASSFPCLCFLSSPHPFFVMHPLSLYVFVSAQQTIVLFGFLISLPILFTSRFFFMRSWISLRLRERSPSSLHDPDPHILSIYIWVLLRIRYTVQMSHELVNWCVWARYLRDVGLHAVSISTEIIGIG